MLLVRYMMLFIVFYQSHFCFLLISLILDWICLEVSRLLWHSTTGSLVVRISDFVGELGRKQSVKLATLSLGSLC